MFSFKLYILSYASRNALLVVLFLTVVLNNHNLFAQDFEFARLSGTPINTTGWNMQGNAKVGNSPGSTGNGEIILTEPINTQSGAIFYNTPINLSQCKKWVAEFEYRINDGNVADGIAFCYLDVPPSGFVSGGGIGIPATANGLKVVIDTWLNCGNEAVPKLQIRWGAGYDECNGQPTRSNNGGQMGFLRSTTYNKCRIEYMEGNIKVLLNGVEYLTAFQTFNFTGYFGFTASTGGFNDRQSIKNVRIFTEMPPSQAAAGNEAGFCPDGTALLGTLPNPGYSYKWTPTTGLSNPAIANPSVTLPNTGTNHVRQLYYVETAFTDRPGCASRDSVWVNVWANPKPNFEFDAGCLPGSNILFKNNTQYDPDSLSNLLWGWNFGDPASGVLNTSSAVNPTHFYNQGGPFTVSLSSRTDKGCTGSFQKIIDPLLPKPLAEFSFMHSTCLADNALFTSSAEAPPNSGDSIVQWKWIFGDNQIGSGKTVSHKYAAPGTYEVKHVSISSRGCVSDTTKKTIVVNPNPVASFTLTGPFCQNRNFNVVNTSTTATGTIVRWQWDMGNGQVFDRNNGDPFTYAFPTVGTFTVKLLVTLATGCQSDTARQAITVGYVPVPGFVLPDVCLNDAFAEFTNTTTIADGSLAQTSWLWNYGDPNANAGNPNTGNPVNGRHRYTATGIYPVKLMATSTLGCKDSLTQNLTVNGDKPLAVFNFVNSGNPCSNLPVSIQNKSTVNFGNITRVVIYWNSGVNNNDTTQDDNPSFDKIYEKLYNRFSSPAVKSIIIRFRVFSGTVCVNETTRTFNLYAAPDVKINTIPGICLNASPRQITQGFDAGNNAGTGIYSGVGVQPNGLFTPSLAGAGTFPLQYKFITTQGCADSAIEPITVFPYPIVDAGPDQIVLQGGQVTLRASVTGSNNYIYSWTPATWLSNPSIIQPISRAERDITYTLTVTAAGGCSATDDVFVKQLLTPIIPNAFSPNGDGINDTWIIRYLDSYPGATVQIFDRYGKRILMSTGYNTPWDGTIGGKQIPAGVYYYIVDPKNGLSIINGSVTLLR